MNDRIVYPNELSAMFGRSMKTIARWRKEGKLPAYDQNLGQQMSGWKRSTLIAHGMVIPERPRDPASQRTPEASAA